MTQRQTLTLTLGDAPIEDVSRVEMYAFAATLDKLFNGDAEGPLRKTAFVLIVFPFNGEGDRTASYISNGNRKDLVVLFKEMAAQFEGQPQTKGTP